VQILYKNEKKRTKKKKENRQQSLNNTRGPMSLPEAYPQSVSVLAFIWAFIDVTSQREPEV